MSSDPTRWTVIQRAAAGSCADRERFVERYASVIRAYLDARWRNASLAGHVDDAMKQVFLECFEDGGALSRASPEQPGGFRAFLYGVVRNVARKMERTRGRESKQRGDSVDFDRLSSDDESLAKVFDRAWASSVLQSAAELHLHHAAEKGEQGLQRHRLLALRYGEGLAIREIARSWNMETSWLHGQFRLAREEFRRALEEVVRDLQGGRPESVAVECEQLLDHFS